MTSYNSALALTVVFVISLTFGCGGGALNAKNATEPVSNADGSKSTPAVTPTSNVSPVKSDPPRNVAVRSSDSKGAAENRCGWFSNPTPGNAWLTDREGEWTIGAQGGHQADGDWPDFPDDKFVKTNINYGYGCACMNVTVDRSSKKVIKILSATAKPLSTCRHDPAIKGKEPKE